MHIGSVVRLLATALSLTVLTTSAFAQTPDVAATPLEPRARSWSVGAGYDSTWMRDVSGGFRPVDASPVSWEGRGWTLLVRHDRATARRLHRFEGWFEDAGHFVLRTPVDSIARSPEDHVARLGGRYEYRRYPFRDLWLSGFDVGIGVEGAGHYERTSQHFDPAIDVTVRGADFAASVVAAARLAHWEAVTFEVAWVNGGAVGRRSTSHSAASDPDVLAWGGGWLTDFRARGDVRVSPTASIFVTYFGTGRGRFATHDSLASGWRQVIVGIVYAR